MERMHKGQTPPKSGPKTVKNAPFASVPAGVENAPLEPSKDKEKAAAARSIDKEKAAVAGLQPVAQPSLDKDKNGANAQKPNTT